MRKKIANAMLNIARGLANSSGAEIAVDLGTSVDVEFVDTEHTNTREWTDKVFHRGNIYIDGYSTPLGPEIDWTADSVEDAFEGLVPQEEWKNFRQQKVAKEVTNTAGENEFGLVEVGLVITGVFVLVNLVFTMMAAGVF